MVARNDNVENEDVVVWNVFGLTHNPRVEDWPVMPSEAFQLHLTPADFFDRNPALDVPGNTNHTSVEVGRDATSECCQANGNGLPTDHLQGSAQTIPVAEINGH